MESPAVRKSHLLIAAALGAAAGGLAVLIIGRMLPKAMASMMSTTMTNMMEGFDEEGGDPASFCRRMMQSAAEAPND